MGITKIRKCMAFAIPVMLCGGAAIAQPHAPLIYHGGPVLEKFRIFPLYYGNWSAADITTQQNYLVALAGYLSGSNAPAGQQPMMRQYGVVSATVAPSATSNPAATPVKLTGPDVRNIIHAAQAGGLLPAYSSSTLIMLFPAHGFSLDIVGGCAYHASESLSSIYAVVPEDCGPTLSLVSAHEVFEAAANPAGNGWDEAVDGCGSISALSFGAIPGAADNTQGGTCSATGYTKTPAAPSTASCAVAEASAFETRVHVRCGSAVNGISYFAVVTASPDNAARYLELFDTARVRARTLHIFYDPADLTGAYFGCRTADCRVARGVEMF
jgi:hypothetical protein